MVDELAKLSLLIVEGSELARKGVHTASVRKHAADCETPGHHLVTELIAGIQASPKEFFFLDASVGAKKAIARALGFGWDRYPNSRLILLLEESDGKVLLSSVFDSSVDCVVKRIADPRVLNKVVDAVVEGGRFLPEPGIRRLTIRALPSHAARVATLFNLSPLQCGVLYYLAYGKTSGTIAHLMGVDEEEVKRAYVTSLLELLRCRIGQVVRVGNDGQDSASGGLRKSQQLYSDEMGLIGSPERELVAEPDPGQAREASLSELRRLVQFYGVYSTTLASPNVRNDLDFPVNSPRYLDPATGATWNGLGRPPRWLQGVDRSNFAI